MALIILPPLPITLAMSSLGMVTRYLRFWSCSAFSILIVFMSETNGSSKKFNRSSMVGFGGLLGLRL